jgi:histidyl-tRNA synthetase
MNVASLPGFRDFYPDDLALRSHIFSAWREVARRYGFVEYDGPPLEALELYTRKSGEEIVGQLYRFTDQGGREVALRPEMTPTLARMVAARAGGLPKPIRWFSIPQLFRYERPQKGRLREHFQLNLDIVGEPGELADAEIVAAAVDVLRELGLGADDFVARVSDRRLMAGVLQAVGVPAGGMEEAFAVLDRMDRESEDWVVERLTELGAPQHAPRRVLELTEKTLGELGSEFGKHPAVAESTDRLHRFFGHLEALGLERYVRFDARLVRGLAYYTGLVFELWDAQGKLRAICGGGRYDDLLASLGGPDLPALGFGMGDVVLGELLQDRDLLPRASKPVDDYVVCVSAAERKAALGAVRRLRESGRAVAFDLAGRSVGRQFKAANQLGAERAIVIGPDELARNEALVREMESGREMWVALERLSGE